MPASLPLKLDLRWWLGGEDASEVEPLLLSLLREIDNAGSLQMAARNTACSYRHAWGLLRKWERLLGHHLVTLERGRGAKLAPLGRQLLREDHHVRARLAPELESLALETGNALSALMEEGHRKVLLRIFASHGLAVAALRDLLLKKDKLRIDLQFRGSLDSLRLYRAGKCDVAGFHLPQGALGEKLLPKFTRYLDDANDRLVRVVQREQGLMMAKGNPKKIKKISDLTGETIRYINRQPGSGTRLIFDALLEEAGIKPEDINGYHTEEFTHMAVAALIASGAADAGMGIRAAAVRIGLGFVPLVAENYYFVFRRDASHAAPVTHLITALRGREYAREVATLPGYDASGAGELIEVANLRADLQARRG
jgi:molybdate transport repressor ModE-like protein